MALLSARSATDNRLRQSVDRRSWIANAAAVLHAVDRMTGDWRGGSRRARGKGRLHRDAVNYDRTIGFNPRDGPPSAAVDREISMQRGEAAVRAPIALDGLNGPRRYTGNLARLAIVMPRCRGNDGG